MGTWVECVPNFSEGFSKEKITQVAASLVTLPTVKVLNVHLDANHNRAVITVLTSLCEAFETAVRAAQAARDLIDLRAHQGVHPRLGALDVLPFVPLGEVGMEDCVKLAHEAGRRIAGEVGVPVYFYGAAALRADRVKLEDVRRGGFERRRVEVLTNKSLAPDIPVKGLKGLHLTAGAVIVGARKILIAYNVNLHTADVEIARRIARNIRASSSGGLPALKALGLYLQTQNCAQVSMNLVDYEITSIADAFNAVAREAAQAGVKIRNSELVGLAPQAAIDENAAYFPTILNFHHGMILEQRIAEVMKECV